MNRRGSGPDDMFPNLARTDLASKTGHLRWRVRSQKSPICYLSFVIALKLRDRPLFAPADAGYLVGRAKVLHLA